MKRLTDKEQRQQSAKAAILRNAILEHKAKRKANGKGTMSRSKLAAHKRSLEAILKELLEDHAARGGKMTDATLRRFKNLVFGGHGQVGRIKRFNNPRKSNLASSMQRACEQAELAQKVRMQ